MRFRSTKTYGNERGLSATFRQWRAKSHCRYLHGYALGVHIEFEADELDENGWVYDFGKCKWIEQFLKDTFDHKTVVADDDPMLEEFHDMASVGLIQLTVLPGGVGCERFAKFIFEEIQNKFDDWEETRVRVAMVKVFEHGSNAAVVMR